MTIEPFQIHIPDADLLDLRERLVRARIAPASGEPGGGEGIDPAHLDALLTHWRDAFDWRATEARLNRLSHHTARIAGQTVHFVQQHGQGPQPMPLVLTHGWPGSFLEMERLMPLLCDPAAHGADAADSFSVVVPSLPGFGFSPAPREPGTGSFEVAGLWAELMRMLGYERFGAQGGDIGAGVSAWLGVRFPERVVGMHMNYIPGSYRPPLGAGHAPVSAAEQNFLDRAARFYDTEGAYAHLQGTKPHTLAIGLNDSPAGLAAWIAEKFAAWSDWRDHPREAVDIDSLLANISLYWYTQTIGSSFRMYVEGRARPMHLQGRVAPPVGVALFPRELPMPPRSWVERCFDVQRWETMQAGGHFAALEQPALLAEEIRAFFRPLRDRAAQTNGEEGA
jgi:pimeloyl-ACP methyl ester carboxylesterase